MPYAITVLLLILLPAAASAQWSRIDSLFARELKKTGAPGGVLALIRNDSLVHLTAFGVRSTESMDPVTPTTLFRVASVTKMLTGLTAADLARAGTLDLSRPLDRYVSVNNSRVGRASMMDLLSHTSGLRDASAPMSGGQSPTLQSIASSMSNDMLLAAPREIYSYSNIGFMLAGAVIERVAKQPFADVVTARVLRPLGMTSSTFSPLVAITYPFAVGHAPATSRGATASVLRPFVGGDAFQPRGGLISTAGDMAKLLIALMNRGRADSTHRISEATVAAVMTIHGTMADDSVNHYGLGMRLVRNRGRREIGHYGGGYGYGAVVRGLPDDRVGVIILANQNNTLLNETADSALALLAPPKEPAPPVVSRRSPIRGTEARSLAGRYRNNADQDFKLVVRGDSLVLLDDDTPISVVRTGERTIAAVDPDGNIVIQWTVVPSLGRPSYLFSFGRALKRE